MSKTLHRLSTDDHTNSRKFKRGVALHEYAYAARDMAAFTTVLSNLALAAMALHDHSPKIVSEFLFVSSIVTPVAAIDGALVAIAIKAVSDGLAAHRATRKCDKPSAPHP